MSMVNWNSVLFFSIILLIPVTAYYLDVGLPMLGSSFQTHSVNAQSNFNMSKFNELTNTYLQAWEELDFQSIFDTYVSGIVIYDVYNDVFQERGSNVFIPGEDMPLYIEPVGFTHNPITKPNGEKLYKVDMAINATILASNGTEIESINEMDHLINGVNNTLSFHHMNTDIYLLPLIKPSPPLSPGNYTIKYTVTDVPSGKNFDLVKNINIVTEEDFCLIPAIKSQERSDCQALLSQPSP